MSCENVPFAYNSINNENGEQPGDVITGSSNLSYQGLQGRTEINVRFTDKGKYTEGKQIFDELWSNAIPIVDENTVDRWKEKSRVKFGLTDSFSHINFIYVCSASILTFRLKQMCVHLSTLPMESSST